MKFEGLEDAMRAVDDWQRKTFGDPEDLILSAAAKLEEEACEYHESVVRTVNHGVSAWDSSAEELADVVFMVVQAAESLGINLGKAVMLKLAKNNSRNWEFKNGVFKHEKENQEKTS